MAVSVNPQQENKFYQAPLEVPGYVNPSVSPIPAQPIDLYGLMNLIPPKKSKITPKAKNPYEMMMEGADPFAGIIPDVSPLQSNLATLEPLDDSAGLFHSQDGFGKYGYSTILGAGDNENRYAQNFRNDNPNKFYSGLNPFKLGYRGLYWSGAFLEKTLESAVVKVGQGFAGLYGMTIGNTIDAAFGKSYEGFEDWLSSSTDNVFSNIFNSWDENLKERYHYFQEKSDRERKGFIQSLGDGDFWMNDISDGLGFLASSMFEVGLISKLGLGTKAATRLAPLAEGVSTEALSTQAVASNAIKTGFQKTMNLLGVEGSGHMFVKNAVDLTTQTLATTAIESAVEAQEVKERVYQSFDGRVNPETGYYYTEEEKQRLSAAAAAETFKQNMTILAGPKFLETLVFNRVGKYAKGLFNKAADKADIASGRASAALRSRLGNLSSGTSYDKASSLRNIMKIGSLAATGFLMEGLFEENIQLAIARQAEETFGAGDEYFRPSARQEEVDRAQVEDDLFGNVAQRYYNQTMRFLGGIRDERLIDDELSKSIGIGGVFGLVGGAVHGQIGLRQQAKIDNYWNTRLNAATSNLFESQNFYETRIEERADPQNPGKTKPTEVIVTDPNTGQPVLDEKKLATFLNKMNNIQGIMDIITNTEDPSDENNKTYQNKELNKLARNVLFAQLAMEYVRAGKKNLLLSSLSSASQFSDRDIQALGYEPGMMFDQDKKNMLERMINIVQRLDKIDQWIENNVLDNVSEPRQGNFGLAYTKTQREKRLQEFEAKKAYLRGLGMQNVLLDSYLDDINQSEINLEEPPPEILSSVLDENGIPVTDFSVPLSSVTREFNGRIPALRNQLSVLEKEFAYHWDNMLSRERNSPKGQSFNDLTKTNNGKSLVYNQIKAQEALEKINELQSELDDLTNRRNAFLNSDKAFELREEDGEFYVLPRNQQTDDQRTLEQIEADKIRRINGVKREEIGIQKRWIDREWKLTAALKEPKVTQERPDTYFSRRMTLSRNAYNMYFQREVMGRDNSLGQRKMKLYDKDESKRVTAKKYKNNEDKLLKAVRIQGKVRSILSEVNGQKLVAELNALLERDLPPEEFSEELQRIIAIYNGKPLVLSPQDKTLVDDQIDATQDEYNFVAAIFEYMPEDDRFNDKYYDIDRNGNYIVKPEYDSLQALAAVQRNLQQRLDDLNKIKNFLRSVPESTPGDWNNTNLVRRRIADVYFETADSIIDTYNQLSNNGQSEISGDSLSTKQDLDLIEQEIDELGQLKVIFEDRDKTDKILSTTEFQGFIDLINQKIADLEKIRKIVKERLSSRLRENQDFLIDTISNHVEQLGLKFTGDTAVPPLRQAIESVVGTDIFSRLVNDLLSLQELINKDDQTAEDKKNIENTYWSINGQVSAIQEVIKSKDRDAINKEIQRLKKEQISNLENTALMQKLKQYSYYKDIQNNINDSVLGTLQLIFYQSEFSQVGVAGAESSNFLDDQPSSPVYKFREDYNLRKFIRNVENDNSRTPDNTEVSKDELMEFLSIAKNIQSLEDLSTNINSNLNLLDQVEREKEIIQAKIDKKDNKYENLIVPSIQQLFFIRKIASFLKEDRVKGDNPGFRNWIYIQAPGGAGKTQTLGTWFNTISGIPKDRLLATAFTKEASKSINKALLVEENPRDVFEMVMAIKEYIRDKNFDYEALIIDEFPAIDVQLQKELYDAVSEYTRAKLVAGKGEFKVVTMGDTNQLTFSEDGSVTPRPSIIINPNYFNNNKSSANNENHPAKITIIPSLTVNFRTNIFAITSFVDQFRGSNKDNVNANIKVASTNPDLNVQNVKGVVAINKADFQTKLIRYLNLNKDSTRTKALIVNENKLDQYKKLLADNGITVITDPNDEITKGVYVTTVKNVQGFSFDEVFVDLENNDKILFSGTSSPNYIYNKAMYVAASRARNLIVVTNFPNFESIEDDSINTLENKALEELQTKDGDFIAQRDLEINSAKSLIGSEYNRTVRSATPVQAEDKVETPLDEEDDQVQDDQEVEDEQVEEEEQKNAEEDNKTKPESQPAETPEQEQLEESDASQEGVDESTGGEVVPTSGIEDNQEIGDVTESREDERANTIASMWEKIRDNSVKAYNKLKSEVIELLFPTAQSIKYKISDGNFTVNSPEEGYENRDLREGDKVYVIPFQQSKTSKSPRKFGYAIITPAIDQSGEIIENSYRTIAVLSDYEIDKLKEKPETTDLYNAINDNERREKGFVSITYSDVSDENGFITTSGKIINELQEGVVSYAKTVKYFYGGDFKEMNRSIMDNMIDQFIENFYANHINSFPESQRQAEYDKIRKFYQNSQNAQIIIPTRKDVEGPKPLLNVPPELRTYVRAGRPYMMFRPFHRRSSMQFIALSRKYLDSKQHNEILAPIRDFINLAKAVRTMLDKKGVTNKMGYSKSLSNMLSKLANTYVRNPNENSYDISLISTSGGRRVVTDLKFTNNEAERIYNLFSMYSEPNTQMLKAETEKEIINLTNVRKARNYIFDDGEVIYGTIDSYDPNTKTFQVKDIRSGDLKTKSGVIHHSAKSYVGRAQQALDDIMNSNGNIASKFTSVRGRVGFVTDRDRSGTSTFNKGYKFMALLGSKTFPVAKSYSNDGTAKEYYEDIIDILEDLFNFAVRGELPAKNLNYINEEGIPISMDVKFRVPVPLNARNEAGELEYDYTFTPQNTSRDTTVPNSRFFESNFESMLPTRVFVEFTGQVQESEEPSIQPETVEEIVTEQQLSPVFDTENLTREDINTLSFNEIRARMTPEQVTQLDEYAKREGFGGIDHFFEVIESNHPEEQAIFRDYIIECLL